MKRILSILLTLVTVLAVVSLSACDPVDKDYATKSDENTSSSSVVKLPSSINRPKIMSDDKIMPQYVDISVFDEEHYSSIYLGKRFKFNVTVAGDEFTVPTTIDKMDKLGWKLLTDTGLTENTICYAGDSIEAVFQNEDGIKVKAIFFNSSNSSVDLKKCNIVKFKIENNFYANSENYNEFSVNGVNNKMAITDIIDTLGTPSHFYGISESNYYLDYFITAKDRRNGITVYINPTDDAVTAIEFSYYK